MTEVKYITPEELVERIKSEDEEKKVFVIDVRGEDYRGGNIKDAINLPYTFFDSTQMKSLRNYVKSNKIRNVVFHCMYSQMRGPSACIKFEEYCKNEAEKEKEKMEFEVFCLSGGYRMFRRVYSKEKDLFENTK